MYNRSDLMKRAWAVYGEVRYECERRALASGFIPERFRNALRGAWSEAKRVAVARPRTADELRACITAIECSADFLTADNRAEIEALRSELRNSPESEAYKSIASEMRERVAARLQQMREGTTAGLSREDWRELGAFRDQLRAELSASVCN